MAIFKEFKEFAMKGNVLDLAIGVVIGGAFQKIVNSLVNDIIMPLTGIFTGNVDYSEWKINILDGKIEIRNRCIFKFSYKFFNNSLFNIFSIKIY